MHVMVNSRCNRLRLKPAITLFLGLVTACLGMAASCPISFGQEKAALTPAPPEMEEMMVPFRQGLYEASIQKSTQILAKLGKPEPHVLYWRAYAEKQLGWLDEASGDLATLGDFEAWPNYPSASALKATIDKMIGLRPTHQQDVRIGNRTALRVYYDVNDDFSRKIVAALPGAYIATSTFLHSEEDEIPIFLFNKDEHERFFQFFALLHESAPHGWWRLLSSHGSITFSEADATGNVLNMSVASWTRSISHELTHVYMQRTIGHVPDFPNWFNEGAAQISEANIVPSMNETNDVKIRQLQKSNALLSIEELSSHSKFDAAVDDGVGGDQTKDPYAQGFSLTRYLLYSSKGGTLADFFKVLQQKRSFEMALQQSTGMDSVKFYASWMKAISN